jgi:hypothetical protein
MNDFGMLLAVSVPSGVAETINNFLTAGQIIGGLLAGIFLLIAAIQLMSGGRNSVETSKFRIVCTIIGMILVTGCSVIKTFIDSLIAI